ncbi:carbohydrate kinase [Shimia sp.]|uniref:carbohydrate kinase family protein n=1 Tax=Shimia sp. TaxID=1954381 RepID=UPI003564F2AD
MILCCGEAVIDMLPATTDEGAAAFRPASGGAAVNVAIALARLGQRAGFFGGLSRDAFGAQLSGAMRREGVDLAHVTPVAAPSTLAFVHPAADTQGFSFYDQNSAGRTLAITALPPLDGVRALVFGGLSLIHRPGAGTFETLMQMAGPERLILLDANIRPALIEDQEQGYRQRLTRMMAMADVLKFSDEDLDWLRPDPPEQLLLGRASLVMHTHGANGATLYSRHGSQHLPTAPQRARDTVGAGDTFCAGVLASLAEQGLLQPAALARAGAAPLTRAVAYGIRAATYSVTRAGANPPTKKELSCGP